MAAHGANTGIDTSGMPKWLDGCLLHRRDSQLGGLSAAFCEFVREHGGAVAACRMQGTAPAESEVVKESGVSERTVQTAPI